MASKILQNLNVRHKRFLKFGVPMMVLIIGGSFGLKEFTDIKIKRRDQKYHMVNKEEALKMFPKREKSVTLEEAYQEINSKVDIDAWENKRGPRPWEHTQRAARPL